MARYPHLAPQFTVQIGGANLPHALRGSISSLTYTDGMEGADSVEVTYANQNFQWLGEPLLAVDQGFKLFIGYAPDPLEEVFVGEITGVEPTFPNGGMPTIRVTAHDFLQRLTHGKVDRSFAITEPEKWVRTQSGESDFDFLSGIAKDNGWQMYIDHTQDPKGYVLRFQFLIQDYSPSVTLEWGKSIMDFTPRITTVGDVFGISARVWVASLQMEFTIVVSWDYDRAAFNLMIYPGLGDIEGVLGKSSKKTI